MENPTVSPDNFLDEILMIYDVQLNEYAASESLPAILMSSPISHTGEQVSLSLNEKKLDDSEMNFLDSSHADSVKFGSYNAEELFEADVPISKPYDFCDDETVCPNSMPNTGEQFSLSLNEKQLDDSEMNFLDSSNADSVKFGSYNAEELFEADVPISKPYDFCDDETVCPNSMPKNIFSDFQHIPSTSSNMQGGSMILQQTKCDECGKVFSRLRDLRRHEKSFHGKAVFECANCQLQFSRKDALSRHMNFKCKNSKKRRGSVHNNESVPNKKRMIHSNGTTSDKDVSDERVRNYQLAKTAFEGRLRNYRIYNEEGFLNIKEFLSSNYQAVKDIIEENKETTDLNVNFKIFCKYSKYSESGLITDIKSFKTKNQVILASTDIHSMYEKCIEKILAESSEFQEKESGWTLEEILYLEIRINKFNPMRGSSYIELPLEIQSKKAIINVKNKDQECFKWAVLSALYPANKNADRVSKYEPFATRLKFNNISFPVNLKDIKKFEDQNVISINVYSFKEDFKIYPLRITSEERTSHVDLLLIKKDNVSHYCWIKSLPRLVRSQYSKHKTSCFICRRCLSSFHSEEKLFKHKDLCSEKETIRVDMPEDDK